MIALQVIGAIVGVLYARREILLALQEWRRGQ